MSLEANFSKRLLQDPVLRAAFVREVPRMARAMVDGSIRAESTPAALAEDPAPLLRYVGVRR